MRKDMINSVKERFDTFQISEAAAEIVKFSDMVNKFVNDTAPWSLAKEEKMDECAKVLYTVLEAMHFIAVGIYPYCPNISKDINKIIENTNINGETIIEYKGISDNASCALFILYEISEEKITLEELNNPEKMKDLVINMAFLEVY